MAESSGSEKTNDVLRRLFPARTIEDMARLCDKCGLAQSLHRKTVSGQVFELGCSHARWLDGAVAH